MKRTWKTQFESRFAIGESVAKPNGDVKEIAEVLFSRYQVRYRFVGETTLFHEESLCEGTKEDTDNGSSGDR